MDSIAFEDFKKVEIRIGKVVVAEKVEGADKLLRLEVDFGEFKRQIATGIAEWYSPEDLLNRSFPFVVNLEPRTFRGVESQGMLMAIEGEDKPVFLNPEEDVPAGSIVV